MLIMLWNINQNSTPFEYTMSGVEVGPARCRILAHHLAKNTSLLSLHMSRKGIDDSGGVDLAKMLLHNKTLRKLELEGNLLQKDSAIQFGKALKENRTLKYLDLESN